MVYKYVVENLRHIENVVEQLNEITEERVKVKIGYIRGIDYWNGQNYISKSGDLYLRLNRDEPFYVDVDGLFDYIILDTSDIVEDNAYVKLDKNVFDKINDLISKVYQDNRERKAFHEELEKQLKAINKTLEKTNGIMN